VKTQCDFVSSGGHHSWPPTIETFVRDDCFLGDENISVVQMAILKSIFGEALTEEEMKAFLEVSEGRPPRKGGYSEATLLCGIRSGKTDKIAANAATYLAYTFDPKILAPGERAYLPIIAQNVEGARVAWGYVEGKARLLEEKGRKFPPAEWNGNQGATLLEPGTGQMKSITGKEIRFSNRVIVACFPCNKSAIRGKTCIGGIGDEFAVWDTAESAHSSDLEIFRALRGRVATMRGRAKIIKITSPFVEVGVAYDDWKERRHSKQLFVQAPSWVLNPSLSQTFLDEERDKDPEGFNREYGAQFGRGGGTYLIPGRVDEAMEDRPQVLAPQRGQRYCGWIDVGFKHDLYAFGIAHRDEVLGVIFDVLLFWQGTKKEPLDSKAIAQEVARLLKGFGLDTVHGDQYSSVPVAGDYKECDIFFKEIPGNPADNWAAYEGLKSSMRRGRVHLPRHEIIRRDLLSLVKTKTGRNGVPLVAAPERAGFHDDISKVVSQLVHYFEPMQQPLDISQWNKPVETSMKDIVKVTPGGYKDRPWADKVDEADEMIINTNIWDLQN
jgi:hypothetical protein